MEAIGALVADEFVDIAKEAISACGVAQHPSPPAAYFTVARSSVRFALTISRSFSKLSR
jgi:hypothetical protein